MAGDGAPPTEAGTDAVGSWFEALLRILADDIVEAHAILDERRRGLTLLARRLCARLSWALSFPLDADDVVQDTVLRIAQLCNDQAQRATAEGRINRDNIHKFSFGVLRMVALEHRRSQMNLDPEVPEQPAPAVAGVERKDPLKFPCVQRCLKALDPQGRALLTSYYSEKVKRLELAAGLGIDYNTLRQRKFVLIKRLRACWKRCLKGEAVRI